MAVSDFDSLCVLTILTVYTDRSTSEQANQLRAAVGGEVGPKRGYRCKR